MRRPFSPSSEPSRRCARRPAGVAAVTCGARPPRPCNVVKHFSFEERGSRRIHQTPKRFEVEACKPWLAEELRAVESEALVFLGATAAEDLRVVAQALGWREP